MKKIGMHCTCAKTNGNMAEETDNQLQRETLDDGKHISGKG